MLLLKSKKVVINSVKWENGSGTDPGSEEKNIRILYYFF